MCVGHFGRINNGFERRLTHARIDNVAKLMASAAEKHHLVYLRNRHCQHVGVPQQRLYKDVFDLHGYFTDISLSKVDVSCLF